MQKAERRLISLQEHTIVAGSVVSVSKMRQPANYQTPEIPYLYFLFSDNPNPLIVSYESDELVEEAYKYVVDILESL